MTWFGLARFCIPAVDDPDGPVEFTEHTISPINLNIKILKTTATKILYYLCFLPFHPIVVILIFHLYVGRLLIVL